MYVEDNAAPSPSTSTSNGVQEMRVGGKRKRIASKQSEESLNNLILGATNVLATVNRNTTNSTVDAFCV